MRGRRRWWLIGAIGLGLVLAVFRNRVLGPPLLSIAEWAAAEFASLELELEGIGGSWYGGITLERVDVAASTWSVKAEGLAADWRLIRLVRGDLEGLKRVSVERAQVAAAPAGGAEVEEPAAEPAAWPSAWPEVHVGSLSFQLDLGAESLAIEELGIDLTRETESVAGPLRVGRLAWTGVDAAGEEVLVQGGLNAELVLGAGRFGIPSLDLDLDPGRLRVRDVLVDETFALASARGALTAEVTDLLTLSRLIGGTASAPESARGLKLDLALADGALDIERGSLEFTGGRAEVERGRFLLDAADPRDWKVALSAALTLDDLATAGEFVGREDWRGSLSGRVDLSGTVRRLTGAVTGRGEGVWIEGRDLGTVDVDVTADAGRLVFESFAFDGAVGVGQGSGTLDLDELQWSDGSLELALTEALLGEDAPFEAAARLEVRWAGDLVRPSGSVRFDLESEAGSSGRGGRVRGAGEFVPREEDWFVELRELEVAGQGVVLTSGDTTASVAIGPGGVRCEGLQLSGGAELLSLTGAWGEAEKRVTVEARLQESIGALELLVPALAVVESVGVRAEIGAREARVDELDVQFVEGSLSGVGRVPFDFEGLVPLEDELAFEGEFTLPDLGRLLTAVGGEEGWTGSMSGRLTASGPFADARLDVQVAARGFGSARAPEPLDLDLEIVWQEVLQLERLSGTTSSGALVSAEGRAEAALQDALRGEVVWADVPLDLATTLRVDDAILFTGWSSLIRRAGGALDGKLAVGGTVGDPALDGELTWREGELKLNSRVPSADALEARFVFANDELVCEGFTGELGGAPFALEGRVQLGGEVPILDLQLRGEDLAIVRERGIKFRGDVQVAVNGPLDKAACTGSMRLTDARYTADWILLDPQALLTNGESAPTVVSSGPLFSLPEPLAGWTLELTIDSEQAIEVDNNLLDARLRPDLKLKGTGRAPELHGTVYLDTAQLSLFSTKLSFEGGTVRMVPERPRAPLVDLRASTRMRGYDVELLLSGSAAEPVVDLSSSPSLPRDSILTLLLTGQPPEDATVEAGAKRAAFFLAQDAVARWLAGDSAGSGESWAERLEVDAGADVTASGAETIEIRFRLTQDPRSSRNTYMVGERDIHDRINYGVRFVFQLP